MNAYESYINEIVDMSVDILNIFLKNGYIALSDYFDDKSNGLDKNVYELYKKGINLMISGRSPEQLELLLEMEKIQLSGEASLSTENILLITIIQKLIPCIQTLNLELFSDLCRCILSKDKFNELQMHIQDMKALEEVAITINEGAKDTQDIAEKTVVIVEKINEVKSQMSLNKQNAHQLEELVSRFKI